MQPSTSPTSAEGRGADPALAVRGLGHAYLSRGTRVEALRDISLEIGSGERIALLGPNGSGKSTLLRALSGALRPEAGEVALLGRPVLHLPPRDRARQLAFVPQDIRVDFPFTVREIVMMGRFPYQGAFGVERAGDGEAVDAAMDLVGVRHLSGRSMDQLSGGEAQRVIIAQALAQEPRVLLLDEPTSHLDVRFQVEVMELMRSLNETGGLTVVASLHDLNLAAVYAHRVFLLRGGRLCASGTPAEALTAETVREVYGVEVHVGRHPNGTAPLLTLLEKAQ